MTIAEMAVDLGPEGKTPEHFAEPWMARAFGLVTVLSRANVVSLAEFQQALIRHLRTHEKTGKIVTDTDYYTCWLEALSELLQQRQLAALDHVREAEQRILSSALERREHQHAMVDREDGKLRVKPISFG